MFTNSTPSAQTHVLSTSTTAASEQHTGPPQHALSAHPPALTRTRVPAQGQCARALGGRRGRGARVHGQVRWSGLEAADAANERGQLKVCAAAGVGGCGRAREGGGWRERESEREMVTAFQSVVPNLLSLARQAGLEVLSLQSKAIGQCRRPQESGLRQAKLCLFCC